VGALPWGALCFLFVAALHGAPLMALERRRALDLPWLENGDVRIEWKDTWEATYKANKSRWRKEIERLTRDRRLRERRLASRLLTLLEKLIERYPRDTDRHIAAHGEMADHCDELGLRARRNTYLKRLAEEFPGRLDLAAHALSRILEGTPRERRSYTGQEEDWIVYAATRLIALGRVARLPDGNRALERAWKALFDVSVEQNSVWRAAQALDGLERTIGRDPSWKGRRAELLLLAGRGRDALEVLGGLAAQEAASPDMTRRMERLASEVRADRDDLPGHPGLEMRWNAVRSRRVGADPRSVHLLLRDCAQGKGTIPRQDSTYTSVWAVLDRFLLSQQPAELVPLRQLQHREAPDPRAIAEVAKDSQALFALHRCYPWAPQVHQASIEFGERALRLGHVGLAFRAFQDALLHASDPETRFRAQVGLWLGVVSETGDSNALEAAFAGVPDDAAFPWMGERKPASFIRRRLMAGLEQPGRETASPALSELTCQTLVVPPVPPWRPDAYRGLSEDVTPSLPVPAGQLQVEGGKVLFSGPNLLACFGNDVTEPLWSRSSPSFPSTQSLRIRRRRRAASYLCVPGPFLPAFGPDLVVTRWGTDADGLLTDVVAFAADTGEMLWSTARDPQWEGMSPVSDPALSDGRVYVMAIHHGASPMASVYVACLDAEQGATVWKRRLASQNVGVRRAEGSPGRAPRLIDLAHYGNAVTVHQGEVYCSTNLGLAARCDARDGLLEWARTYPRIRVGRNYRQALRKQGASPIVAGNVVVFSPRDYGGTFALERHTGKRLWDNPFVPCDEAVGLTGGTVLLRDSEHLVALDVLSGRVLWERRFPEGIRGRPRRVGSSVYLATKTKLHRIAARTGCTLEERKLSGSGRIRDFAIRSNSLMAYSENSAWARSRGEPPSRGRRTAPVKLPLEAGWQVASPDSRVLFPPAAARVPGRLYLLSEGRLTCIRTTRERFIEWERVLAPGLLDAMWAANQMVLVYPERALALDAPTGALRWETGVPFVIRDWGLCGSYLLVGSLRDREERYAGLLRLSTGELLWHRRIPGQRGRRAWRTGGYFAWDGAHLHFFTDRFGQRRDGSTDLIVRPSDGEIVDARPFPGRGRPAPERIVFGEGFGFYLPRDNRAAYHFSLSDGSVERYGPDLRSWDLKRIERMRLIGPWLHIVGGRERNRPPRGFILRRGDPGYVLRREVPGVVRGDKLYKQGDGVLTAIDLPTKKEVAYEAPFEVRDEAFQVQALDFREHGDEMVVLFGVREERLPKSDNYLRVDLFDRRSGRHLGGQRLRGVLYESPTEDERRLDLSLNQLAVGDATLFVTDRAGLYAFVPALPREVEGQLAHIAHRVDAPITIDGSTREWDARSAISVKDADGHDAKLYLARDADELYVAARYRDPYVTPRIARRGPGGDCLEVGLTTTDGSYRWFVGTDRLGRTVCDTVESPEGATGSIHASARYDAAAGEFIYELATPMGHIDSWSESRRRLGLSITAWDDRPGSSGPIRRLAWGKGILRERTIPSAHETIYLHTTSREADEAAMAIVHALPELPESFDYFKRACRIRAASPDALPGLYARYMKRHPRSASPQTLLALDEELRVQFKTDPTEQVLAAAEGAGVAESIRRTYRRQAQVYLSQWVYLDSGRHPLTVLLELYDGMSAPEGGWEHRVYWYRSPWSRFGPPRRAGRSFPERQWHELRIPLTVFGMSNKPICGISFAQRGGGRVIWDRTAVVFDGVEHVLLDDHLPEGMATRSWEWVDNPVHSGKKAHTHSAPQQHYAAHAHGLLELDAPLVHHIEPPLGRPYLSQWVFLDSANPPRMASLDLHDGRRWRFCAIWGENRRRGRYMGPLPKPGQWHELRLPLGWTPFCARPIAGIAFGHLGGRVVWDRTAVVGGGKEHILIDDETPPVWLVPRERQWLGWLRTRRYRHVGRTTPFSGKLGVGVHYDGYSGYVEVPHSPALEPTRLTVEAWVYLANYPTGYETRRWIVNKNRHECTDGHYALVINGDRAGAYLNIGDAQEGRYDVWSALDTLTLKRWHHLAMTYDGATLKFHLNGAEAVATPVNKERVPGTTPLHIGRRQDGYVYFEGMIDEVRVYNRALSAEEIKARYAAGGAPPAKGVAGAVVGHWGFDDGVASIDPAVGWKWVGEPTKSGKKAHTQPPGDGFVGHLVARLRGPIVQHLPFEMARAATVLKEHIPRLGPTEGAWRFFRGLLQLHADPRRRIELLRWFVRAVPGHPREVDVLPALLATHSEMGNPDAVGAVEAFIREHAFAAETLYRYHRRYIDFKTAFVRDWQVLGPFPNPGAPTFGPRLPPDGQPVDLERTYKGAGGEIRWRAHTSETNYVDFDKLFKPKEYIVAYAACWVHAERKRKTVLAISSDDDCTVWINRQRVLRGDSVTYAKPGQFITPIELQAGWNEVLVKVTEGTGEWRFYFELLDPLARAPLEGVLFRTTDPRRSSKASKR